MSNLSPRALALSQAHGPGPVDWERVAAITQPVWQPIETAPRDGTPFWGMRGDDAVRMLWHSSFDAFVSRWHRMTMAPGYTWVGDDGVETAERDHSPVKHEPTHWMPLPDAPA